MPKILIIKEKRAFVPEMEREFIVVKGKKFFVEDTNKDFHTKYGIIKAKQLKTKGGVNAKTTMGKEFCVFDADFSDNYEQLKRLPQAIVKKDVCTIIAETCIGKDSVVVDAGTGSGFLACFLANICRKVTSYDIEKKHLAVAQQNVDFLKLKNVLLKNKDVTKGIDEKDVDVIIYDLPEPWLAIKSAEKALKTGGFLVAYSPNITQVQEFVNTLAKKPDFLLLKTVEVLERKWKVDGRIVHPAAIDLNHTGFMVFARKIC
jgi:tRNA (adenine57-N1/adenine58-N1)-methyltransferase